jgi:DNA uptake protein ComE-like DNA-binding protein
MQAISVPVSAPSENLIWVQGEAGAKSYLVAPNKTIPLWDSENQTIYLKSADASGMPSMKILDYTIRTQESPLKPLQGTENAPAVNYATKDDLQALKGEIMDMVKEELKV